jgi:hypothetical protein
MGTAPSCLFASVQDSGRWWRVHNRQPTFPSAVHSAHHGTDVPEGSAMVLLMLQSAYMPKLFCLHSEPKWLAMDRQERHIWNIVKRCETREEANRVLDEVRAAAKGG